VLCAHTLRGGIPVAERAAAAQAAGFERISRWAEEGKSACFFPGYRVSDVFTFGAELNLRPLISDWPTG
jgi:hypothetical protein